MYCIFITFMVYFIKIECNYYTLFLMQTKLKNISGGNTFGKTNNKRTYTIKRWSTNKWSKKCSSSNLTCHFINRWNMYNRKFATYKWCRNIMQNIRKTWSNNYLEYKKLNNNRYKKYINNKSTFRFNK